MPGDRRHSSIIAGDRFACISIRQSVKRCLSPGWTNIVSDAINNKVKRQQKNNLNNPFMVLVKKGQGSSDRISEGEEDTGSRPSQSTDLIGSFGKTTICSPQCENHPCIQTHLKGSFGKTTSEDQGYDEPLSICPPAPPPCLKRKDNVPSATSRQINSNIQDTYSSLPVLDTYSSLSSFIFPLPASPPDESRCSLSGAKSYSTSYTSWTAPLAGHSDSCVPGSSILDREDSTAPVGAAGSCGRVSRLQGSKMFNGRGKRDCSADTCKDIDDIDDLELDELDELASDDEAVIEEEDLTKKWGGPNASPDLAYGSMIGLYDDIHHSV